MMMWKNLWKKEAPAQDLNSINAREENLKRKKEELEEKEGRLKFLNRQFEEKEAAFQLEKDIFNRKVNNWKEVDESRLNNYKQQTEFAKLEARRDALKEALKENDTLRSQLLATKDDQINTLKALLTEAIKALQVVKVYDK